MMQVLVVDNENPILDINKADLENNPGFSIDAVKSAHDALERMKSSRYDVVIFNYQIPETDGPDFLKTVRNGGFEMPLIIFTGRSSGDIVRGTLNERADLFPGTDGDPGARLAMFTGLIRHVLKMKMIEKELPEVSRQFRNVTEFLPDATFVIDSGGRTIVSNSEMEKMTGIPGQQMLGKDHSLYSEAIYGEKRPMLVDLIDSMDDCAVFGYKNIQSDEGTISGEVHLPLIYGGKGGHFWGKASLLYGADGNVTGAIESIRDVTELREYERCLYEALEEKNIIIREVHHRVRNNLQIISALVQLQQSCSCDENLKSELEKLNNRIFTMAAAYEMLLENKDANYCRINVKNLVNTLIPALSIPHPAPYRLSFDLNIFDEYFDLDTSVSVGLILNELLSCMLMHSTRTAKDVTIRISMERDGEGMVKLTASSGDLELSGDFEISCSNELGARFLSLIVEKNLKGDIGMTRGPGITVIIRFAYSRSDSAASKAIQG
ncbi:signal transduction histidine kinase [Methanolacinia petrolearia DSM 11571]|uniref:histidine kinase n=1 Tax=Methanolacinia petrolearia (strain DSM 11571 / OCM 486 / SEBR 4847) TaxID=679926 RepID=E1RKH3_METP4|nr:histidine kinase dimerization/phosphoacceptor domain -containing protein [Methanolacinia petrolearia]ADN35826.1 signal transduction histidine kinase [Methanolacinia petrolearia DSM 11571]